MHKWCYIPELCIKMILFNLVTIVMSEWELPFKQIERNLKFILEFISCCILIKFSLKSANTRGKCCLKYRNACVHTCHGSKKRCVTFSHLEKISDFFLIFWLDICIIKPTAPRNSDIYLHGQDRYANNYIPP